jgi:hypothetical protein
MQRRARHCGQGLRIFLCWLAITGVVAAQDWPSPTAAGAPAESLTPVEAASSNAAPTEAVSPAVKQTETTSPAPRETVSPTSSQTPAPAPTPTPTPSPTSAATPARTVKLSFVPPPMRGTISLGIFDANGDLVRVLFREAKISDFTVADDALTTTWDGTDDSGGYLPAGRYRARGYMVARLKVEDLGKPTAPPPIDSDHAAVRLIANPLINDVRSVVDLGVGFDKKSCYIQTMDDLPLYTVSKTPKLVRAWIARNGNKSVYVWEDDGAVVEQFRISNINKMMAFDCGFVELQ